MADITKIKLPSGDTYNIKDNTSGYATLASPAFTGTPTAPTQDVTDNSTKIATTGFVKSSIAGLGSGTVTSVGITNATNGGLSISNSPIVDAGNITVGHSNVLTNAATTQALYPVKIDKNGHISAYGTAVTSLPASDVYSWAKASTKPTYTASEVGAATSTHTHTTGITGSTGTSQITLAHGSKYALSAGGTSYIFTMPAAQIVPTGTGNSTTGISIGAHGTTSIGSASGWNAGSASSWTFEEKTIPNVTDAGSASTWTFGGVTVANSISGAVDANDSSQLNISVGTTTVQSKTGGGNGSAPTLGTAIKVQSKSGGSNGTAPSLTVSSKTVVTGTTHTITDNGHTHTLV